MRIYIVQRNEADKSDYDEYDSFVIRAKNKKEVRDILNKVRNEIPRGLNSDYIDKMIIEELSLKGPAKIICSSFEAG